MFETNFNEDIYSISISKEKKQIYLCLSKKKIVKIIHYDLNTKTFTYIQNGIIDTKDALLHFNKCISISNDLLATSDDKNIAIWSKTNNKAKANNYNKIKTIQIYSKTFDLFLVNNDYFITSQPDINTITIIDIKSLNPSKYIPNIDCIDSLTCFLLFKNYIIINCKKGIAILSVKTKEICQFIEIGISEDKQIFLDNKDNICILSQRNQIEEILFIINTNEKYNLRMEKIKLKDGLFEVFEDYNIMKTYEKVSKIICLNDGDFIFQGDMFYVLREGEDSSTKVSRIKKLLFGNNEEFDWLEY